MELQFPHTNGAYNEGTTRKDWEENFTTLVGLHREYDRIYDIYCETLKRVRSLEEQVRDAEKACQKAKRFSLFRRKPAANEETPEARLARLQRELATAKEEKQELLKEYGFFDADIIRLGKQLGLKYWNHTRRRDAERLLSYFTEMEANTLGEALALFAKEDQEAYHKRREAEAAMHREKVQNAYREVLKNTAESEQFIARTEAELAAEDARIAAEKSAKKAHNTEILEDFLLHAAAKDIEDMETYAAMKAMDLDLTP